MSPHIIDKDTATTPSNPPEVPYRHTAGRATRRILVLQGDERHLIGLRDLLDLLSANPDGPWTDAPVVRDFLAAHHLLLGDVIDLADDSGAVWGRLGVTPRGLRWAWVRGS